MNIGYTAEPKAEITIKVEVRSPTNKSPPFSSNYSPVDCQVASETPSKLSSQKLIQNQ